MIQKFRKKPVVIEAEQLRLDNADILRVWCGGYINEYADRTLSITIPTLEGEMRADLDDWIIKGVKGEFYPCKPDIFEKTYEKISQ